MLSGMACSPKTISPSQRNQTGLIELGLANGEESPVEIHISPEKDQFGMPIPKGVERYYAYIHGPTL